ncbi:MAG TPA: VCBS repeat-containing protein [Polyangiaceae bacterium]|nr:VCBS repeat-containing protein [Polyangiaceae bacterium]
MLTNLRSLRYRVPHGWTIACVLIGPWLSGCEGGSSPSLSSPVRASDPAFHASQAITSCGSRTTQTWGAGSFFTTAGDFFETGSRDRIWVTDANGDGVGDVIGIGFDGTVWVATGTNGQYNSAVLFGATRFTTTARWFTNDYRQRVFVTDVTNDGIADIVGVNDAGTVYFYLGTGTGFVQKTARSTVFAAATPNVGDGFWDAADSANAYAGTRVWLADVSGDHKLDLVGVSNAGDIWVYPGTTNGFGAVAGPFPSAFKNSDGYFQTRDSNGLLAYHDNVWVSDYTGDGVSDIVGIAPSGQVQLSRSLGNGTTVSFDSTITLGPTVFRRNAGWFDVGSQPRIWLADVSGDGRSDVVGIAPPGQGDGDIWVAQSSPWSLVSKVWLHGSVLKTQNDWLSNAYHPRIWVGDVSGDKRADVVGVDRAGGVWVAKSLVEESDTSGTTSGSFLPSLRVGVSDLGESGQVPGGYFDKAFKRRVWLADATNDGGLKDLIAIRPNANDGDITWTSVLPTSVVSIADITRDQVRSGGVIPVQVKFSRAIDCAATPANALVVWEKFGSTNRKIISQSRTQVDPRTCAFDVALLAAGDADVKLTKSVEGIGLGDRFGNTVDGNGNGFIDCARDKNERIDYIYSSLVGGADKTSLDYADGPAPLFPSADLLPVPFKRFPNSPPPMARFILLGGGSRNVAVLMSVELVGVNPGRLRDLISARTGIPTRNVVIAATHSHTVPHTLNLYTAPTYDDRSFTGPAPALYEYPAQEYSYVQWIEDSIAEKVAATYASLVPVKVAVGTTTFEATNDAGPLINRRDNAWQSAGSVIKQQCPASDQFLDPRIGMIAVYTASQAPLAMLVNFGLHPVIVPSSLGMTPDFTGYMSQCLEDGCAGISASLPKFPTSLFVQAGGGDIIPTGTWTQTEADADRISRGYGRQIANRVLSKLPQLAISTTNGMSVKAKRTPHMFRGRGSCNQTTNCPGNESRPDEMEVDWQPESTAMVIGAPNNTLLALGTVPGEAFSTLNPRTYANVTSAVGSGKTFLFGYANGYFGYFPDTEARSCALALEQHNPADACSGEGPAYYCDANGDLQVPPVPGPRVVPGELCYAVFQCSDDAPLLYGTGPTFLGEEWTGAKTAGESIVDWNVSVLNQLATQ